MSKDETKKVEDVKEVVKTKKAPKPKAPVNTSVVIVCPVDNGTETKIVATAVGKGIMVETHKVTIRVGSLSTSVATTYIPSVTVDAFEKAYTV